MGDKSIFVLAVALITWGGVFLYLLRLSALAKRLERELRAHEAEKAAEPSAPPLSLP